jgi:hypothetical protein
MNGVTVVLTLRGGWLFARADPRTRSLLATAVGARGSCSPWGWGRWFVTGA